jgi:ATP-dependent Lhr-like helicase
MRYGVVFRRLLDREANAAPWRELLRVYWRLEARGEVRGGRFVAGVTGEQFALPEAVGALRAARRREKTGELISISAVDPLNLTGMVLPGERVAALANSRIAFRDGVPVAVREGGKTRLLVDCGPEEGLEIDRALVRKRVSPALRALVGASG